MGRNKRTSLGGVCLLAALISLTGCFPLPVSLAFDGIMYAASGKTVSDHFLSSLAQRDCSVGRALTSQQTVCLENDQDIENIIVDAAELEQDMEIQPASGDAPWKWR